MATWRVSARALAVSLLVSWPALCDLGRAGDGPPTSSAEASAQLEGRVTLGPWPPAGRSGEPRDPIPPEAYTSRWIEIRGTDGQTLIATVPLEKDGSYRVALPPGSYRVTYPERGADQAEGLPRTVTLGRGETKRLDISIDTGVR